MSDAIIKMDWVNQLKPMGFMDEGPIREAFIKNCVKIKGMTPEDAEMFCEKEAMYLKRVIFNSINPDKPRNDLRKCTVFSLYACFMDMSLNGWALTFNPDDKLAYIEKRGYAIGRDAQGAQLWEDRAKLIISPYGELNLRIEAGQVRYADPAIVVYEGDFFEIGTNDQGNSICIWKSKVPRSTNKIVGSFIKVTRPDGSFVMPYLLQEDIDRLAAYSNRQNFGKGANALYGNAAAGTGIDAGFLKAKTLKFAFKTFPKMKLKGSNSSIDEPETTEEMTDLPEVSPPPAQRPVGQSPAAFAAPSDDRFEGSRGAVRDCMGSYDERPRGDQEYDDTAPGEDPGMTVQDEEGTF